MCERAPTYARLKSLKVSPQSCSQQEELRKRRWKRGSKGSIIWRLRHCYRLFQGKVDVFNFEKPPGLLHVCLETSCLVRSALCSRTLPRSKIDSYSPDTWAASGTHMKHTSAGGGTNPAPRSACCRTVTATQPCLVESGGKFVQQMYF